MSSVDSGDATLIWSPTGKYWLVEIIQDGIPTFFTVFDAVTGSPLGQEAAINVSALSERFSTLEFEAVRTSSLGLQPAVVRLRSHVWFLAMRGTIYGLQDLLTL